VTPFCQKLLAAAIITALDKPNKRTPRIDIQGKYRTTRILGIPDRHLIARMRHFDAVTVP
jgi:hypothetical protein